MHAPMPDPYARRAQVTGPVHPATRERLGPLQWFARGGWYLLVVVGSLGILSFVPFLHAATRLRTPVAWLWVALYSAAVTWLFSLTGSGSDMGGLAIGLMIIAVVHSVVLRRQVWPATSAPQPAPVPLAPAGVLHDPAVAAVLAARARREDARRLAAADPQMARELRVGRPDLPRTYDDGGLVDLNSAPPQVIADTCGIPADVAERIADVRSTAIAFSTVDDLFSCVEVPYPLWDRIRDRAVVIAG